MFSLLLIIAFLCANLPMKIQAFPSYCKNYLHLVATNGRKTCAGLCGCAEIVRRLFPAEMCAESVRAVSPLAVKNRGLNPLADERQTGS